MPQNDPQTMMKRKINARISALRSIGKSDDEIADAVLSFPDLGEATRGKLKAAKAAGKTASAIEGLQKFTTVNDSVVGSPESMKTKGALGAVSDFLGIEKAGRRIGYGLYNKFNPQATEGLSEEDKRTLQTGGVNNKEFAGSLGNVALSLAGGTLLKTGARTLGIGSKAGVLKPVIGSGARNLTAAQLAKRPIATIAGGAATGYAGDVFNSMNNNESAGDVFTPGLGTVIGGGLGTVPLARNLIGGKGYAGGKAAKNFDATIDLVAPKIRGKDGEKVLMSPSVSLDAPGWFKEGTANFSKDTNTQRIAHTVQDFVNPKKSFSQNAEAVKGAIKDTAENTVKPFLADNNVPFNFQNLRDRLTMVQPRSGLKADPSAFKNYNRIREEVLDDLAGILKKSDEKGSMTDMNELWNARKAIDARIENELGDFVEFGSPQYRGARAAATDLRREINNFIVDSISNPGQAEELNKFYEFMNVAASRGMKINNADEAYKLLRQQMGVQDIPEDVAKGAFFKFQLNRMSDMYEAAENIVAKAKSSDLGKTKLDQKLGSRAFRTLTGLGTVGGVGLGTYAGVRSLGGGDSND